MLPRNQAWLGSGAVASSLSPQPHDLAFDVLQGISLQISISDSSLDDLRAKLDAARLPRPTYELGAASGSGGRYGVKRDWLISTMQYWRHKYEWSVHSSITTSSVLC